jgi:nicotinamidase-related amidase
MNKEKKMEDLKLTDETEIIKAERTALVVIDLQNGIAFGNRVVAPHTITKRQWGAFFGTDLDLQLRRRGIDTIALCGISTGIGVDTTAREAYQHGYNQIFIEDAMTARTEAEHDYVCKYIFPKIGKLRTSEEVISLLK